MQITQFWAELEKARNMESRFALSGAARKLGRTSMDQYFITKLAKAFCNTFHWTSVRSSARRKWMYWLSRRGDPNAFLSLNDADADTDADADADTEADADADWQ